MKAKYNPGLLLLYMLLPMYPVVVHFGLIENSLVPLLLVALIGLFAFSIKYYRSALLVGLLIIMSLLMLYKGMVADLYFLPPIVINLVIGAIFINGLRPNQTPVIEKYILLMEGAVSDRQRQYARWVTVAWSCLLVAMLIESIVLALYFSHETWSLFTNFINYLVLGLMFLGEYVVRIYTFPDEKHMQFMAYLNRLRKIRLKSVVM
jgi:uncharacterized membrane protein